MQPFGKQPPNDIRNDLASSDEQGAHHYQSPPKRAGAQLRDIQRHNKGCATNRSTDNRPTNDHAAHAACPCLPQRTEDEKNIGKKYHSSAAVGVGEDASQGRGKECEERGTRGYEALVKGREQTRREIGIYGYQGRGYDTSTAYYH